MAASRVLLRALARTTPRAAPSLQRPAVRGLALKVPEEQGYVPDLDGLTAKARAEAAFERVYGGELFAREAQTFFEEGTRENPIPILSTEAERVVGISLPDEAETRWFTLRKNELIYDPDTCNFFALKQVSSAEVDEWVRRAEKQALGGKA